MLIAKKILPINTYTIAAAAKIISLLPYIKSQDWLVQNISTSFPVSYSFLFLSVFSFTDNDNLRDRRREGSTPLQPLPISSRTFRNLLFNSRFYYSSFTRETGGFELVPTIDLVLPRMLYLTGSSTHICSITVALL